MCKQAIIIDPVDVTAERDAEMMSQMGLKPTLLLNTHVHADHITCVMENCCVVHLLCSNEALIRTQLVASCVFT